jgi:hypothetical protein
LGGDVLDDLLRYVSVFDFAVLVLTADDLTSSKGRRTAAPRDNVIFELGLFMGVRGRRRAFAVIAPNKAGKLKLPSDLAGNTKLQLDPERLHDDAYLTEQIGIVRGVIEKRSREAALSLLPSAGLAFGYFHNFIREVFRRLDEKKQVLVDGASHDIGQDNYDFTILVPPSLVDAAAKGRDAYVGRAGLRPCRFEGLERPVFFVHPPRQGEPLRFADYPTTLRSSLDVILLALHESALGEFEDVQKLMEQQEISNFVKALKHLLRGTEAAGFREKVKFQYLAVHPAVI